MPGAAQVDRERVASVRKLVEHAGLCDEREQRADILRRVYICAEIVCEIVCDRKSRNIYVWFAQQIERRCDVVDQTNIRFCSPSHFSWINALIEAGIGGAAVRSAMAVTGVHGSAARNCQLSYPGCCRWWRS